MMHTQRVNRPSIGTAIRCCQSYFGDVNTSKVKVLLETVGPLLWLCTAWRGTLGDRVLKNELPRACYELREAWAVAWGDGNTQALPE